MLFVATLRLFVIYDVTHDDPAFCIRGRDSGCGNFDGVVIDLEILNYSGFL